MEYDNENEIDPLLTRNHMWEITASCPVCGQTEEFLNKVVAKAWQVTHIQDEHEDVIER